MSLNRWDLPVLVIKTPIVWDGSRHQEFKTVRRFGGLPEDFVSYNLA